MPTKNGSVGHCQYESHNRSTFVLKYLPARTRGLKIRVSLVQVRYAAFHLIFRNLKHPLSSEGLLISTYSSFVSHDSITVSEGSQLVRG